MKGNKITVIKNVFSVGAIQIANYVFPMFTIPIVSRTIGPDKLGVINFSYSFITYFTLLIGFGFDLTATRRVAANPNDHNLRNRVFSEVLFSRLLLLIISSLIFVILLNSVQQLKQEKIVAMFTFMLCIGTFLTQNWLFQAMQDLPKIAILNLISKVLFSISVILYVKEKSDYIWQPLALSISQIIMALGSFVWCIRRYDIKIKFVKLKDCIKLLWNEKIFFFSLCVINLYTNTNIVVLGLFQSSQDVGYYTAAQKLISIMQSVISIPLTQALFPYIGKAFGESKMKGIDISQKILPIVIFFTFVAGIIIFFGAPLFINIIYGGQFAPAIVVCKILAFIPMIIAISNVTGIHMMLNLKQDKKFFIVTCVGASFSVAFNFLMIKGYGYVGAAYNWLITEVLVSIMFYLILNGMNIEVVNKKYFKLSTFVNYVKQLNYKKFKLS